MIYSNNLCGLTAGEILQIIEPYGFNYSHAAAITNNIYKKRNRSISGITGISKRLKSELMNHYVCGIPEPSKVELSADGTKKYLFRNDSGLVFETVFIPDGKRNTVCISTQSGCRMGCPFCVSGSYGFRGNISAGEMISQVIGIPESDLVTHIVFMGMGEPMDNLDNVLKACKIITTEWGLSISPRNVTVSSIGLTDQIEMFLKSTECNLTVSLHSPFSDERRRIIPAERRYPVKKTINMMKEFPLKKKRRLSLAYIMIKDLNDSDSHLRGLIELLKDSQIRINLLPYHPLPDDPNESSSSGRMNFFKHNLVISGISASIRKSRGIDISAACGLLASGLQ
jgi:23S rRNA (adenine2503-C2)-methyltransferase